MREKDVWEFQARSGSSGSCSLFLSFLGKIAVQEMSGKTPGSPRHPSSRHPRPSDLHCIVPVFFHACFGVCVCVCACVSLPSPPDLPCRVQPQNRIRPLPPTHTRTPSNVPTSGPASNSGTYPWKELPI